MPERAMLWPVAGFGFGVVWIDHVLPFHFSASVRVAPEARVFVPTTTHAREELQETFWNAPPLLRPGVDWSDQELPFHSSARGSLTLDLLW
jgi:hypothetical protein